MFWCRVFFVVLDFSLVGLYKDHKLNTWFDLMMDLNHNLLCTWSRCLGTSYSLGHSGNLIHCFEWIYGHNSWHLLWEFHYRPMDPIWYSLVLFGQRRFGELKIVEEGYQRLVMLSLIFQSEVWHRCTIFLKLGFIVLSSIRTCIMLSCLVKSIAWLMVHTHDPWYKS